jgi:excinuclease ABC subunit A
MSKKVCPHCQGKRLNEAALCVKVHGHDISQICDLSVIDALHFFQSVPLTNVEKQISELILKEIISRLEFLSDVGLNYLTLSRSAVTLSGGEAQRIRLATQIGSKLTGVIYILDEPSIGLHQKDNQRLINTLKKMRDLGNTIIVVEHDLETMEECDHLIDIGPFAGHLGGKLMASASPQEVCLVEESITGQYLSGRRQIPVPAQRRLPQGQITLTKVTANNLKGFDVAFPLGVITVVTGVSGSGKSTLVNETLYKGLLQVVKKSTEPAGAMESLKIQGKELKNIIEISQAPIGRTPRSNPATYTRLFDDIRDLFAQMRVSRERGYVKARFSFNVKGGRCESCNGDGVKKISMHFLPDVYVKCEDCGGKRYNKETLDVLFNGYNIAQVLEMTVDEALELFVNFPKPYQKLRLMQLCGLGYLHLGQSSLTLSGGEAQRIKLASELYNKPDGQSLYILDEPTTGLHSFDVEKLLVVLHQIADSGATVVIIEHNLDVIKNADYIIDLGPEGGLGGGQLLCCGTPEEVSQVQNSYTGQYLKQELERSALRQKNKEQAK